MADISLHQLAPRLARARDAWLAEARSIRAERRRLNDAELHKQWLVDHRDLQLQRAQAAPVSRRRRVSWIASRARKLEEARVEQAAVAAQREAVEQRAEAIGL